MKTKNEKISESLKKHFAENESKRKGKLDKNPRMNNVRRFLTVCLVLGILEVERLKHRRRLETKPTSMHTEHANGTQFLLMQI